MRVKKSYTLFKENFYIIFFKEDAKNLVLPKAYRV
jgi:hypothetical protein